MGEPNAAAVGRRTVLLGALLAPLAAACSIDGPGAQEAPDPLIALAEDARADAALAGAIADADAAGERPWAALQAARTEHAAALDAEVARLDPDRAPTPTPAPALLAATPAPPVVTSTAVRDALAASAMAAAAVAIDLPVERVGLVSSVAACCAAYLNVLA